MTEDHKHCRGCRTVIPPGDKSYCSKACERIHDALVFGLIGCVLGSAAYFGVLYLLAIV